MLDQKFTVKTVEEKEDYFKLELDPLHQGYGHTLGNALRRVLLTSLKGSAVTTVKVKGIRHQFTTLDGMSEDIVQLILNIKALRVRLEDQDEATLKLEASGPGEVKAKDIGLPVGVTIGNPDLVIANLEKGSKLEVEMKVENGTGYSLADERKSNVIGEIPVDALFSPITRVNPEVVATRVGRRTDFDKLILEIWTDGTISGKDALDQAAQILVDQFSQIYNPTVEESKEEAEDENKYPAEVLKLTVEELDLPTRIANALRKGGYKTVGDLTSAQRDEVVKVKNLGERSVRLVEEALSHKGVTLEN